MKDFWNCSADETLKHFGTTAAGLSDSEVLRIRGEKGENALMEQQPPSIVKVFLSQFCDLLIVILIIAAIISMFSGNAESTIVILLVLIMNAILGTVQHVKAQRSLDSLKQLSSPSAKVMRNGQKVEVPSKDIVPGDLVLLEAGDLNTFFENSFAGHSFRSAKISIFEKISSDIDSFLTMFQRFFSLLIHYLIKMSVVIADVAVFVHVYCVFLIIVNVYCEFVISHMSDIRLWSGMDVSLS